MKGSTIHVAFGMSGAGSLRAALDTAGCNDEVAGLVDCPNLGPIHPYDQGTRAVWFDEVLGYDWDDLTDPAEAFWRTAQRKDVRLIAWMSRRSTADYCGFLEWLWRMGDRSCEVIDLTHAVGGIDYIEAPGPLGLWRPADIIGKGLFDRAAPLGAGARQSYHELWRRMREENADLRVLENGELRSASISFFDAQLQSHMTNEWQKMAHIVGSTLVDFTDAANYQTGDLVLFSRLRALAEAGDIKHRGDLSDVQNCWLRLP